MQQLFSIVIPTRDRPNLLREAIESALEQEFDDYEIIVSDNSTNSETEKVVSEFESKKLKYFRTPKPLDMPRSWDFALSKANGKFITFLADDDLLPKKFLQFYSKVINLKENIRVKVFSHPNMNLKVRNNIEGLERKKKEI
jgi:glycosyltransferase involved in cell wall biosynthesis